MKNAFFSIIRTWVPAIGVLILLAFGVQSCAPKYGCPVNEETHVDFDKKKKRSDSDLFGKKMSKKMR